MNVHKIRRDNLRAIAAKFDQQGELATIMEWTPSYLSQLIGPNPSRNISERTARAIEFRLGHPPGSLDMTHATVKNAIEALRQLAQMGEEARAELKRLGENA